MIKYYSLFFLVIVLMFTLYLNNKRKYKKIFKYTKESREEEEEEDSRGSLLTTGFFHAGFANKIFNIVESMLVSYQSNRCFQSIPYEILVSTSNRILLKVLQC